LRAVASFLVLQVSGIQVCSQVLPRVPYAIETNINEGDN